MSVTRKHFGTDGIRGRVGQYPITPDFMLRLGWATGVAFRKKGACRILVGKDTRISGYMFESALESGLASAGVNVQLLGPMPTPAVAYLTRTFHADAGIVISASHNGHNDNGIKFFSSKGTKLPDDTELMIEELMSRPMEVVESQLLGKASRINDAAGRYTEFCKSTVPNHTSFEGMKIVVDCANGATYKVAPNVFKELGAEVISLFVHPNGLNINDQCGSTHPAPLVEAVKTHQADLGIGFDGDGDRVVMVDHAGGVVEGDELLFLIARDLKEQGKLEGGVVGTQMSNLGLELAFQTLGIPFARANVGDRYVMSSLLEHGWQLGGENSGHIVCKYHTTTGDGIVAALQVLMALKHRGQTLAEARQTLHKCPQRLINIKLPVMISEEDLKSADIEKLSEQIIQSMDGKGRVLLRKSGTEPVIRVMVEGQDAALVDRSANALAELIHSKFS